MQAVKSTDFIDSEELEWEPPLMISLDVVCHLHIDHMYCTKGKQITTLPIHNTTKAYINVSWFCMISLAIVCKFSVHPMLLFTKRLNKYTSLDTYSQQKHYYNFLIGWNVVELMEYLFGIREIVILIKK